MRYFRSWTFNTGLALIFAGVLAWQHGIAIAAREMDTATWHNIDSPQTEGSAFTFRAGYTESHDAWLPASVMLVIGGFAVLGVAALRVRRQR